MSDGAARVRGRLGRTAHRAARGEAQQPSGIHRIGLTPVQIAALSFTDFVTAVRAHQAGRRVWRFTLAQVHRYAQQTVACPDGLEALAREIQRAVSRIDALTD